jgi:hypothetical protein
VKDNQNSRKAVEEIHPNWREKLTKKTEKKEMSEERYQKQLAKQMMNPVTANLQALIKIFERADIVTMGEGFGDEVAKVLEGDLSFAEMMLISQAQTLQSIFINMTSRMEECEYISQMEAYSKVALRAQNQCNRTLKTLLDYKNPKRATFIKQQNNLQINEAEKNSEKEVSANELLEENHDARLDTGTAQETIGGNQEVEALGKVHRAKD